MGLGIRIGSEIKPRGILRRRAAPRDVYGKIAESIPGLLRHPLHARLSKVSFDENGLEVRLHPAEEPVEFRFNDAGMLIVSAKTSSAGPGYHAFLVDLLDRLGDQCNLAWIWDDEGKEFLDETGYAGLRNFPALQEEMAALLRNLARILIEKEESHTWSLSMPLDFGLAGDHFAISSMGFWERPWFESAAKASSEGLLKHASEFFPWWEKGREAEFWLRFGLVKCWLELPWHPAKDEEGRAEYRTTIECFSLAKHLDPTVRLPDREIEEMKLLMSKTNAGAIIPVADRIGYRRRMMRRSLPGKWSVLLPGYYYESTEEDDSIVLYWYGDRAVWGSSLAFRKRSGEAAEVKSPAPELGLRFTSGHLTGSAKIEREEQEGRSFWMLKGTVSSARNICIVTISFQDPADEEWALETWRSVYRAPDEQQAEGTE